MTSDYTVKATAGKKSAAANIVVEPEAVAEGAPARYRVLVDGTELVAVARRIDERGSVVSWSLIDADGRQRLIDIDGNLPDLKVSLSHGEPVQIKVSDRRDAATEASTAATTSGNLRAAMPGKVVKVLVQPGDTVKAGQGLLVIEAMKMENELRAPAGGKIAAISVREGQAVEAGQELVALSIN